MPSRATRSTRSLTPISGVEDIAEILVLPQFANIRDDPRWPPFLESIGKSPEQLAAIEFEVALPE